ncbi:Uncharacterised protein [Yersinia pekkanenii]|uniref:Uncharacterized protein n=1 Tax=Yersinia pekkanenii TaxID=1288385 RepID=A0ABP1ZPA9_9GAMM|nr:Uncharacterised protein [Yersinia pekkanenii]
MTALYPNLSDKGAVLSCEGCGFAGGVVHLAGIQWAAGVGVGVAGGLLGEGLDHIQRISEQCQHVDIVGTQANRGCDKLLSSGNTATNTGDFLSECAPTSVVWLWPAVTFWLWPTVIF